MAGKISYKADEVTDGRENLYKGREVTYGWVKLPMDWRREPWAVEVTYGRGKFAFGKRSN